MPTVSVFARLPRTSFLPCTKETMRAIRSGQLSLRHGGRSGPARLYERLLLWSFGPIRILSAHENTSRAETGLCHLVSIPCAGPQARPHTDGCARNSWGLVDGSFCDRAHRRRTRLYGEDARPSKTAQMRHRPAPHLGRFARSRILTVQASTAPVRNRAKR